jgi:general secretion pathway protein I
VRKGFTLLEVMVALAILAAGMMAVSDVVGGAMRNHARATALDVATLLARARMAQVEDRYAEEGFKDFDEAEEGTFEAEGHPEVAWKLAIVKPKVELGGANACDALLGKEALASVLGGATGAASASPSAAAAPGGGSGPASGAAPILAMVMETFVKQQCTAFGETLKRSLREARLTVSWPAGAAKPESFTVATDLVVLQPRKGQP